MLGKTKFVQLIICFAFVTILYTGIQRFSKSWKLNTKNLDEHDDMFIRKGKVVILLSNQRSGSSFVGEFFARFNQGFYLYEPLLPYGTDCDQLENERLEFLKDISQCDFSSLKSSYSYAYATNNVKSHRECLSRHVCSPARHKTILQRYFKLCQQFSNDEFTQNELPNLNAAKNTNCGYPLNLTIWSSLCQSTNVVAFKVLRVCSVQSLEGMAKQLSESGNDVYVIELVRDPRGIINSALNLELRKTGIDERLDRVCGRFRNNFEYIEKEREDTFSTSLIVKDKYLRVRYEDIATDPVKRAEEMYKFMNMDLPSEVREWIEISTANPSSKIDELRAKLNKTNLSPEEIIASKKKLEQISKEQKSPYGTVRESTHVVVKWRKRLKMEIIEQIQDKCGDIMQKLGYKLINNIEERNNLEIKLY